MLVLEPVEGPTRGRFLTLLTLVLLGLTAVAAPAQADSVRGHHPEGGVSTRVDITSVAYRNGPRFASAGITVADLKAVGRAELVITTTGGTDVAYVAKFAKLPDGSVRKRLVFQDVTMEFPRMCTIKGRWSPDDVVRVSVPRSCLLDAGRAHYMRVDKTLLTDKERDDGPVAPAPGRG